MLMIGSRCSKCCGQYDVIKRPKRGAQWVCWGCRIAKKIDILSVPGCWLWTGARRGAYGVLRFRDGHRAMITNAHRVAFLAWREPIPDNCDVIHTCNCKLCCNPDHLKLRERIRLELLSN